MSGKNQFPNQFSWQATNPFTGFLPNPGQTGSVPSGVFNGTMASTNVIYSQILDLSRMDNVGLEVNFNYGGGAASGTLEVYGSDSGIHAYSVTFVPALGQPSGSQGGYLIDLNQWPWKYIMLKYTNATGTGVLTVYGQFKDLN